MFSIVISEKGGAERRETFEQDEVTIGRVQGNDLMLPKGNVSKRHCRVALQNGRFVVLDQESTNGTYVNRRRISQATVVREGDRIYVGDFILRIEADEAKEEPESIVPEPEPPPREPPPRPAMITSPDAGEVQLLSTASAPAASAAPPRSGPEANGRATRESDSGLETVRLTNLATIIAQRVAGAIEPRLLERSLDATLERRIERLVDDTFNELVIEGDVPSGVDETRVKATVVAELCGLGPLRALMDDESVKAVGVSGRGHIAVQRAGRLSLREQPFLLAESLPRVVARLLRSAGIEPSAGAKEYSLGKLGFEMQVLGSDAIPGTGAFSLWRRETVNRTLEDLVRSGTVSRAMATFLRQCVTAQLNVLVVGPPRSGADEVVAALLTAVEGERVVGLPGFESPGTSYENVSWLRAGEDQSPALLLRAGRLIGHRLLVDGMTGSRARALLSAVAEGAQGVFARLVARSIERGLAGVATDLSLLQPGLTPFVAAEALVSAFDVALQVARLPDGRCRVTRIAELERGDDTLVEGQDVFDFEVERTATGGAVEGTFRNTGQAPKLVAELRSQGIRLDPALLSRPPASEDRR